MLKKIFKVEPADRPSATQILDDSWLRYSQDQPLQSFSNSSSSKVFNKIIAINISHNFIILNDNFCNLFIQRYFFISSIVLALEVIEFDVKR